MTFLADNTHWSDLVFFYVGRFLRVKLERLVESTADIQINIVFDCCNTAEHGESCRSQISQLGHTQCHAHYNYWKIAIGSLNLLGRMKAVQLHRLFPDRNHGPYCVPSSLHLSLMRFSGKRKHDISQDQYEALWWAVLGGGDNAELWFQRIEPNFEPINVY